MRDHPQGWGKAPRSVYWALSATDPSFLLETRRAGGGSSPVGHQEQVENGPVHELHHSPAANVPQSGWAPPAPQGPVGTRPALWGVTDGREGSADPAAPRVTGAGGCRGPVAAQWGAQLVRRPGRVIVRKQRSDPVSDSGTGGGESPLGVRSARQAFEGCVRGRLPFPEPTAPHVHSPLLSPARIPRARPGESCLHLRPTL